MKVNDGLSCETILRFFTSTQLLTTDFCGTIPRATLKTTHLMQWHGTNCIVKVFLLSERETSPNYTGIFIDFVHGFGSLWKVCRKRNNTIRWPLRFRFGFGVYVKQPLRALDCGKKGCKFETHRRPSHCVVLTWVKNCWLGRKASKQTRGPRGPKSPTWVFFLKLTYRYLLKVIWVFFKAYT